MTNQYKSHYYEPSLYLCPSDVEYNTSVDVYSFGVLLLEFVLPLTKTLYERLLMIRKQMKSFIWETTHPELDHILSQCLCICQKERISMETVKKELSENTFTIVPV